MFLCHDATGNLKGFLAMHVEDFIFCGNDLFKKYDLRIEKIFKVGTHENGTFKLWGLGVRQTKDWSIVDQNQYVSSISPIDIKKECLLEKMMTRAKRTEM